MNTLTILSMLCLAIAVAGSGYLMGRVPKSFTDMFHAMPWPRRALPYVGTTLALMLIAAPLIGKAADSQYLAFMTLAGGLLFVIAQAISADTADDWLAVVGGIIFFTCSTALLGVGSCWWLLAAWPVVTAAAILLQLWEWRLWFTLTGIVILFVYCLI